MQKIEIVQQSSKPVAAIYAALADHDNLKNVFGVPVRRVRDGAGDVNGVGSVRRLGFGGPLGIEETVTAIEPNRSIDYRISKGGFPIRNHRGHIGFESANGGSRVTWTIEFDSALPLAAQLMKRVLERVIRGGLQGVA
jgi:hypothetical protein